MSFFSFLYRYGYRITLYAGIILILLLLPGQNDYEKEKLKNDVKKPQTLPFVLPPPSFYPKNLGKLPPPELTAAGVVIVDVDSGVTLYKKNAEEKFQPASTTKIMTALVVLDHYPLDQVIAVTSTKPEGRNMGLIRGERLTVESLLSGLLVHSANDAAYVLAENYPGGIDAFVQAMNDKARDLHLTQTHFTNPTGLEDDNHYMSARDLALLSIVALQNPIFAKIVSIRAITVADVKYMYFHDLTNVNQLLGKIPGVAGLKTGWTENARECLVTLQVKEKGRLLTVLLRSADRFGETEKLLTWVGQNFDWEQPVLSVRQ